MTPFERLGLSPDADARAVRSAYAKALKATRPDDDPAAFQRLREARDGALAAVEGREREAAFLAALEKHEAAEPSDAASPPRHRHDGAQSQVKPAEAEALAADGRWHEPLCPPPEVVSPDGRTSIRPLRVGPAGFVPPERTFSEPLSPDDPRGPLHVRGAIEPLRSVQAQRGPGPPPSVGAEQGGVAEGVRQASAEEAYRAALAALHAAPDRPEAWVSLRVALQHLPFERGPEAERAVVDALRLLPERQGHPLAREVARLAVWFGWSDNDTPVRRALGKAAADHVAEVVELGQRTTLWGQSGVRVPPPLPPSAATVGKVIYDPSGIIEVPVAALASVLGRGWEPIVLRYRRAREEGRWRLGFRPRALMFGPLWALASGAGRVATLAFVASTAAWTLLFYGVEPRTPAGPAAVAVASAVAGWVAVRLTLAVYSDRILVHAAARTIAAGRSAMGFDRRTAGVFGTAGFLMRAYILLVTPPGLAIALVAAFTSEPPCAPGSAAPGCRPPAITQPVGPPVRA